MTSQHEKELALRQKLKDDFDFYARNALFIRPKSGGVVHFTLNKAQRYVHSVVEKQLAETGKIRVIIVKGRQQGMSTYIEGRLYWRTSHISGVRAFILTHEDEATANLFDMAKRYHENCLEQVKPKTGTSNANELKFSDLDSGYKLGTAGNKSVGRSSTIQYLHASEVAFYKHADEHAKGIMQTVPDIENTEIFIESTANGVGNWFHQMYQAAEAGLSDYIAIFVPWYWQDEYKKKAPFNFQVTVEEQLLKDRFHLNNDQLNWRRNKIVELSVNGVDGEKSFKQEYPNVAAEAFLNTGEDSYIENELVLSARKALNVEAFGPKIIGVDPARFGDDRTAIIVRQGRVARDLKTYIKKSTMEIAGIVYQLILEENPDKVCVDVGGLGAGVVDRLKELVDPNLIVAVNAGAKPLDAKRYYNKRAEMWATGKEWLLDEPCLVPDIDELQADLCNTRYKIDSNSRLVIEKKEEMKKRGVRSSDCADALLLTFALPASAFERESGNSQSDKVKSVMSSFMKQQQIRRTSA